MALSNWATAAFDQNGEPVAGTFRTPLNVVAEIYKNWIYVQDKEAWQPGRYVSPTIMEISNGLVRYRDLNVFAIRGPQDGVYCICWTKWSGSDDFSAMFGCGVYGYENDDWIGVTNKSLDVLQHLLDTQTLRDVEYEYAPEGLYKYKIPNIVKNTDYNQGELYIATHIGKANEDA